jgi:hypothetical protein
VPGDKTRTDRTLGIRRSAASSTASLGVWVIGLFWEFPVSALVVYFKREYGVWPSGWVWEYSGFGIGCLLHEGDTEFGCRHCLGTSVSGE